LTNYQKQAIETKNRIFNTTIELLNKLEFLCRYKNSTYQ